VPPLTTIQMSQSEIATLAFHALLKETKRETPDPEGTEYVLKTRLVLRSSTTFPPKHSDPKVLARATKAKAPRTRQK